MQKKITPKQLSDNLTSGRLVLIDVRDPEEFARKHIPEAINIPLGSIKENTLDQFNVDTVVMQCNSGNRSSRACQAVAAQGVSVHNLAGGLQAWEAAGLPVESAATTTLPLQRQVQIAVSVLILTGLLLGYLWRPELYLLSGLVALGLLNAGITGWCGMAKLLAKAPWNNT